MMNILFKEIRTVNPAQKLDEKLNIWVKNGVIAHCDKSLPTVETDTQVIDASNYICSPGLFDMHVHLREPGFEYKEDISTGTNSAANGGFTGLVCMPNTHPTIDNISIVEYIKQKSKDKLTDVHIAAALTQGSQGKQLTEMLELSDNGVVMFTDDGRSVMNSDVMKKAFDYASSRNLLISQHCEDHNLTDGFTANESKLTTKLGLKGYPSIAEEIILYRDIEIAKFVGKDCRYHAAHLSTKGSVNLVRRAKAKGYNVTCEVTPHHFTLTEELVTTYDTNIKMNPPLRQQEDVDAMITGLVDGTIDCIATDHAPHALHEKDVEFDRAPNGIIGLETSLGLSLTFLVHTNKLTISQLIEKMSVNPRKILGLKPIEIKTGATANLLIFAPDEEWVVNKDLFKAKSKNTPYNQYKLKGKPKFTINNNLLHTCVL
jgi:dihydroorotase